MMESLLKWAAGIIGGVITFLFGEWSPLLTLFAIAIAVDYISGVAVAIKYKEVSSKIGFWGIARKGLIILIVMIGHHADLAFGTEFFKAGVIYFYLANELISIFENYNRLNIGAPRVLQKLIGTLKDKDDMKGI